MKFSKDKDTPISDVVSFAVGEHAYIKKCYASNVAVTCASLLFHVREEVGLSDLEFSLFSSVPP